MHIFSHGKKKEEMWKTIPFIRLGSHSLRTEEDYYYEFINSFFEQESSATLTRN